MTSEEIEKAAELVGRVKSCLGMLDTNREHSDCLMTAVHGMAMPWASDDLKEQAKELLLNLALTNMEAHRDAAIAELAAIGVSFVLPETPKVN